jgi:predicted permease
MQVFSTIIPIFAVVILGCLARRMGFMPRAFLEPANRLVYYLAIPALIFRSVSKASFHAEFNIVVLLVTLSSAVLIYAGAWILGRLLRWRPRRLGTFIQCSGHGNLGYIGLPVAYYFLGETGLVKAGILAGFLMILQNSLSVLVLQAHSVADAETGRKARVVAEKLIHNPIIVSALAGIAVSYGQVPIPVAIQRFLEILSGLAPPMSLLLIGASLSLSVMRKNLFSVFGAVVLKIIVLPVLGLTLLTLLKITPADFLPALILLATPTATVSYVMSKEMHGDEEFAVAAISTSTIFSAVTYLIWLTIVGRG